MKLREAFLSTWIFIEICLHMESSFFILWVIIIEISFPYEKYRFIYMELFIVLFKSMYGSPC